MHLIDYGSTSIVIAYVAPNSNACTVDVATTSGFTSIIFTQSDNGGVRSRFIAVSNLLPQTTYYYRTVCGSAVSSSVTTRGTIFTAQTSFWATLVPPTILNQVAPIANVRILYGTSPTNLSNAQTFACTGANCTVQVGPSNVTTDTLLYEQHQWLSAANNVLATSKVIPVVVRSGAGVPLPTAPTLLSPFNNAVTVPTTGSLQWSAVASATSYDVYLGTVAPPAFYTNVTGTTIVPVMLPNTRYFWQVVAKNTGGVAASQTWSFTTAGGGTGGSGGAVLVYNSPSCLPSTTYAAGTPDAAHPWACGSYPTTIAPILPAAGCPANASATNTCIPGYTTSLADPDTCNRILRITENGSLNNTAFGNNFGAANAGWLKVWNADSTKVWFTSNGPPVWVGFNPTNMTLTGQSGNLPNVGTNSYNFDATNPNLFYGLSSSTIWKYTFAANGTISAPVALQNLNNIPGWISGQVWLALYRGGNLLCAYSGLGQQGTGRLVACVDSVSNATYMIDTGATQATLNGVVITGIDVGSFNSIHTVQPGTDGRYVFIDTGPQGQNCTAGIPPHNGQFVVDLLTGNGAQLGRYCDETHLAIGHNGVLYQAVASSSNSTPPCGAYDNRGEIYRAFPNLQPYVTVAACFTTPGSNASSHFSWSNNFNDSGANQYPILVDAWNVTDGDVQHGCIGCDELYAFQSQTNALSATVYRFGQKWQSLGANGCSDYIYNSSQVSPNGKFALFESDWLGATGTGGSCPGGKRRDVFIMELK